jgi:putative nucleotidyltransferase with HDIG domain
MEPDSAAVHNQRARTQLPAPGEHVLVRCPGFRCLAYRDTKGNWRGVFGNRQLAEVLEVIPGQDSAATPRPPKDGIDTLLDQVERLPPVPRVLPRLLSALSDPETDLTQIVELVAVDTVLTAKLLRACNSACFGMSRPVNDVSEAVNRLGFQTVYRTVAAVSGASCFKSPEPGEPDADRLWRHSVTTAFAAQFVAEDAGLDGSMLFTAGILHDLGKIVLPGAQVEAGEPSADGTEEANGDILRWELATYGFSHAEVGGRMLERWHFSDELAASVKCHHNPETGGKASRFAACVCLADTLAHHLDNQSATQLSSSPEAHSALEILGLAEDQLRCYDDRVRENLQFVEGMCRL